MGGGDRKKETHTHTHTHTHAHTHTHQSETEWPERDRSRERWGGGEGVGRLGGQVKQKETERREPEKVGTASERNKDEWDTRLFGDKGRNGTQDFLVTREGMGHKTFW